MQPTIEPVRLRRTSEWGLALLSIALLTLAFPDPNLAALAWIALVPLLVLIARPLRPLSAFLAGWFVGTAFFYLSCHWLTYSIIHYGGISPWLAYLLLVPATLIVGLFPACFALSQARLIHRWGLGALVAAPFLWVALEWARLSITGQLWNAIGYSQSFHPSMIQMARWGGVYLVGFAIVAFNAAITFLILRRKLKFSLVPLIACLLIVICMALSNMQSTHPDKDAGAADLALTVVALQPNVPMDLDKSDQQMIDLLNRHIAESETALNLIGGGHRLVIWPESPMNFTYGSDAQLRDTLAKFVRRNHTSLLFNSQEVAPNGGLYNSALLINEEGRLTAQYDKIRLMPFGEYVPLPQWLPGANRVEAIVGGFLPGRRYTLMTVGDMRLGTFICIESAYPWIARNLTTNGAEVLVNISNDGYLGPTAVMRQHLANAVFRAVENGRRILRVTNTGITADISARGEVRDATKGFSESVKTWKVYPESGHTFYTKHGDLFVGLCAAVSLLLVLIEMSFTILGKRQ